MKNKYKVGQIKFLPLGNFKRIFPIDSELANMKPIIEWYDKAYEAKNVILELLLMKKVVEGNYVLIDEMGNQFPITNKEKLAFDRYEIGESYSTSSLREDEIIAGYGGMEGERHEFKVPLPKQIIEDEFKGTTSWSKYHDIISNEGPQLISKL